MAGSLTSASEVIERGDFKSNAQLAMYKITPNTAFTSSSVTAGVKTQGTAELVLNDLAPLMYEVKSDGTIMYITVDGHANSAASIKARVEAITGETDAVALIETYEN